MPSYNTCKKCGKKVSDSFPGHNVWLCVCGRCNFCHVGAVNYDAKILGPHWFEKKGSHKKVQKKHPLQSHGGHGYIPFADEKH